MNINRVNWSALALTAVIACITGCSSSRDVSIQHVVLCKLKDPSQSQAMLADCDRLLPDIKGVHGYWSGTPDTSGRQSPTIDHDWDIALCVGYPDAAAYEHYVTAPAHVELVQKWKPHLQWLRIHDVSIDH